jgi:hypothetical protein
MGWGILQFGVKTFVAFEYKRMTISRTRYHDPKAHRWVSAWSETRVTADAFVWLSRISRQNFERLLSPISLAARSILAKSRVCIEIQTRSVLLSWGSRGRDIGSGSVGNGLTFVQLFSKIKCIIVPHNGAVKGISAVGGAHSPRNHAPHQAPQRTLAPRNTVKIALFFAATGEEYA